MRSSFKVVANLTSDYRRAVALLNFRNSPIQSVILNGTQDNKAFWPNKEFASTTTTSSPASVRT